MTLGRRERRIQVSAGQREREGVSGRNAALSLLAGPIVKHGDII